MTCLLLVCFYVLSGQAAEVAVRRGEEKTKVQIVLDPGHGGEDPGMVGVDELEEKGINLEIAQKLQDILKKLGYSVEMTRQEDKGLYDAGSPNKKAQDMQRRIAFLKEKAPALTVSIHQNSFSDPGVKGPQVFYYESSEKGKKLAEKIQEALNQLLKPERPRTVKGNTSYYLLKKSPCPLVIVECGFLTNPQEAELLQQEAYQEKTAEAIAEGIRQYLIEK